MSDQVTIHDWNIESDKDNIRDGAIELRARVAENMYYKFLETPAAATKFVNGPACMWKRNALDKLEQFMGKPIGGRIVEVGAGTGWCSALLSKRSEVDEIYSLDYDRYSVEKLIPLAVMNTGGDASKVKYVIGSYNSMKLDNDSIDLVVSIGAIHHSENLLDTFREAFRVLKPGGFLFASEHCHPNSYTQDLQQADYEKPISKERAQRLYGDSELDVRFKDNSDHNYRISDFEAFAHAAGFNVAPYIFDLEGEKEGDNIFSDPKLYRGYSNRVFYPYFVSNPLNPRFDNLLLICQKPDPNNRSSKFTDLNTDHVAPNSRKTLVQKIPGLRRLIK